MLDSEMEQTGTSRISFSAKIPTLPNPQSTTASGGSAATRRRTASMTWGALM